MIFKAVGPCFILRRNFLLGRARFIGQERIHFIAPVLAFQQLRPAHFLRDDLVALRMVEVLLEQLHVFLRLMVLLLEKPLPLVLVPNSIGLMLIPGHALI